MNGLLSTIRAEMSDVHFPNPTYLGQVFQGILGKIFLKMKKEKKKKPLPSFPFRMFTICRSASGGMAATMKNRQGEEQKSKPKRSSFAHCLPEKSLENTDL